MINYSLEYWKQQTGSSPIAVCYVDSIFWIEENANYPPGEGNLFLMRSPRNRALISPRCVGGVDKDTRGVWRAQINAPWDPESDTDATVVYEGSRDEAIAALWQFRENAAD